VATLQFSVFTGNILIWIHIPIFNQKIKGARCTRINTVLDGFSEFMSWFCVFATLVWLPNPRFLENLAIPSEQS